MTELKDFETLGDAQKHIEVKGRLIPRNTMNSTLTSEETVNAYSDAFGRG